MFSTILWSERMFLFLLQSKSLESGGASDFFSLTKYSCGGGQGGPQPPLPSPFTHASFPLAPTSLPLVPHFPPLLIFLPPPPSPSKKQQQVISSYNLSFQCMDYYQSFKTVK